MSGPAFVKAHALGNDFLLIAREDWPDERMPSPLATKLCDRYQGIGADGVILYETLGPGVARMRVINADGTLAEMSGNGLRCLGAWLCSQEAGLRMLTVETDAGRRELKLVSHGEAEYSFRADMGQPRLLARDVPIKGPAPDERVVNFGLLVAGEIVPVTAVSMGNPHCAVFVGDLDRAPFATLGPQLEHHPAFPNRTNVEFVQVLSNNRIRVRFWERGVGHTKASGTGGSAAAVASALAGKTGRRVSVECESGTLEVDWRSESLFQTGPAQLVCAGRWLGPGLF